MGRKFDLSLLPPAPDLSFEIPLWEAGVQRVAGIDEAGRGALAGPVAAAAVVLQPDPSLIQKLSGVRDSKQMTPAEREFWAERVKQEALAWSAGFASHEEIDAIGIVPATCLAMERALQALPLPTQHLLVDYVKLPECLVPQTALVKGDARCLSIASASILAKTARDALLRELDTSYPGYGFAGHKGYATQAHYNAIERLGPCEVHRKSFRLVRGVGE
jgi:ribonuclease HII